jgi:hypothetical protein
MGLFYASTVLAIAIFLSGMFHKNIDMLEGYPLYSIIKPYLVDRGSLVATIMFILLVLF